MDKLKFKTFTWPTTPESYHEDYIREPVYEKNDEGDTVFFGMGPMKRVITGNGVFFGLDASTSFSDLAKLFASADSGLLVHPVWGIRTVYFTKLKMTQSPKADYVAYSFEFTEADGQGDIPK